MFTLRFDLRAPGTGAPAPDLYEAALDMCAWAETRGAILAVLSEHHATSDGHLPSPLLMAAAVAARTRRLAVLLAAVVLPLYDPVRLAEEISVLDNISRGRVAYAFGIGHRPAEYESLGVDAARRGRIADANLALLRRLLRGGPVEHEGRRIHVTPPPLTPGGPRMMIAGGSPAAVRRAARHGLGFLAQANPPGLRELFEAESRAHGHEPGPAQFPEKQAPTTIFVADDVDRAWHELGPHLLHDAQMAASYRPGDDSVASITRAQTVPELRADPRAYAVLSVDEAAARIRAGNSLGLHPLCGGLPPDVAWPYLERAALAAARARPEQA
jgi:alkanesulfonate monooxygenase SsuD/methylene tetrahydromethanopterin reductase-like flavin-dependent oxidoreductase (luciferase family)